ncbi:MAG: TonB-dependent receptor plug domain-containing protein [Capsulimonadaceae bacterium]
MCTQDKSFPSVMYHSRYFCSASTALIIFVLGLAATTGLRADSTPTNPSSTQPETLIVIKSEKKPGDAPQANASKTVLSAPAVAHSDPDLTLPNIIARFVPGVSANPDNGLRIRGADDESQTYLDGIPVAQGISGTVTDVLDPKDIQTVRVYTGGFPPELGGQLAGVFDVTSRTGTEKQSGSISQSVAGESSYVTAGTYAGSDGKANYFVSGSERQTNFYLNPPRENPFHDAGHEDHGFLKLDYNDSENDKLILDVGSNGASFENPTIEPSYTPDMQQESGTLANLAWNHFNGLAVTKVALYTRSSLLRYTGNPDDLESEGNFEANQNQRSNTLGIRADQTLPAGLNHLIKAGFDISKSTVDQDFSVVPQSGGILTDDSTPHAWNEGLYVQDDWTAGRFLANYGVRFDQNSEDVTTNQLSPRVNMRYRLNAHDTLHAYYDRLFQPIPAVDASRLVGNASIQDNGTVAPILPERDDFYEVGIDHSVAGLSLGACAYYKFGHDVRDDDQVGNTNITLPVDDAKAYFNGFEFTGSHDFSRDVHGFGSLALSWNKNAGPITGGLNEPGDSTSYFYDDHDQTYTSKFGLAYDRRNTFADMTGDYGSGQPYGQINDAAGNTLDLNYLRVPPHLVFNVDFGRRLPSGFEAAVFADNLLNDAYLIKQVTLQSNTQYAEGRVVGIRVTENF